jgi:hypothetical protein
MFRWHVLSQQRWFRGWNGRARLIVLKLAIDALEKGVPG